LDALKLWEKLKKIPKAQEPTKEAARMIESGELTPEETATAVAIMAMMPILMLKTLET
jgi:hypothetical protein